MKNQTLVVVIPTKNRRALLERSINSVLNQQFKLFRIVVVNDGSIDGTKEYLDRLHDPRIAVVHNIRSLGVNAARNKAFKTLKENEWALQLDDDDYLAPDAFNIISNEITNSPESVEVLSFNSIVRTNSGEFVSGYRFKLGEEYYEPTYEEIMTGFGDRMYGDNRPVWKWTVFPKHLFNEEVNGFEHTHWMELARDGVLVRYFPQKTMIIDQSHDYGHLSNFAAKENPKSFAKAHAKILKEHSEFFSTHREEATKRAVHAMKISIRAHSPKLFLFFFKEFLKYRFKS